MLKLISERRILIEQKNTWFDFFAVAPETNKE